MAKELKVFAAFDGKEMGSVPLVSADEMESYLAEADRLSRDPDARIPAPKRIEILNKTIEIIRSRYEETIQTAAQEGGKPYADSKVEVDRALQGISSAIEHLNTMHGTEIPMGITPSSLNRRAFTTREPVGVVAAISAFNHPFNLIVHQVIPAVAVGCPVIVKPAETTPLSCMNLLKALWEAGLPREWARWGLCELDVAGKLVEDSRLAFFSFIGSSRVGWMLRSKLAPGVTCAMEHGGAAPVIFEPDADMDDALPLLAKGGFYHAGQVCVSVQRVFAHESVAGKLAEKLSDAAQKLKVGDPLDPKTEVGPLILSREVARVDEWVQEAVQKGAKVLCGAKKLSDTTYAPTVILDPPEDCTLTNKEIFGPVVTVHTYKDRMDAVKRANSVPFFFQASVFTRNIDVAMDMVKRLDAMAVMVNDHTAFRVDWMPFGGRRDSGVGVGGISYSMHDMTYEKMMVIRSKSI